MLNFLILSLNIIHLILMLNYVLKILYELIHFLNELMYHNLIVRSIILMFQYH